MPVAPYARQLWQTIKDHNLDAHNHELAQACFLVEHELLADDVARAYLVMIEPMVEQARDFPNPLHRRPSPEQLHADGRPDIELGSLVDAPGLRFGLRLMDQARSVLLAGNAGSGKTTAIRRMLRQIHESNRRNPDARICVIIFDRKIDYVHLALEFGEDFVVLDVHDPNTRIGLGAPDGVPPNAWINLVATMFSARAGMVAAWTCFANLLRWLLPHLNSSSTSVMHWPSLKLVLEIIQASSLSLWAAKPDYEKTLISALEAATQSTHLFDCFVGQDVDRDIIRQGRNLILLMPNLAPTWVRQFLIDITLARILYGRIHRAEKVDRTAVLIVLDEADQDATAQADQQYPDAMSPLAATLRMGREFGIAAVIGLSRLFDASPFVLAEPHYHLVMNQSDARSILEATRTLLLPQGGEQMLPALKPGQCLFRQAQSSWTHPMLAQVDYTAPGRGVLDVQNSQLQWVPAMSLEEMPDLQEALAQRGSEHRKIELRRSKSTKEKLPPDAYRLLQAASLHPWFPVARLWEQTDRIPSRAAQMKVRHDLEEHGLAKFEEIRIGRANVLLLRLTEKGWRFLNQDPPKHQGRGSIAHQHFSNWIKIVWEKRGREARTEWTVPGTNHPVDAAWKQDGQWHAAEVCVTCRSNLESHIQACFVQSHAVASLTIVTTQKGIRDQLRTELEANLQVAPYLSQIHQEVIETYIKELWP